MTAICDQTLSGTQAAFDTNTMLGGVLPTNFSHLRLYLQLRGSAAANNVSGTLTFNNDTGANYEYAEGWYSAAITGAAATAQAGIDVTPGVIPAASLAAGVFASAVFDILDYTHTTAHKMTSSQGHGNSATAQFSFFTAGRWLSTAAITRIAVTPSSGSWAAGSRFTLYGL